MIIRRIIQNLLIIAILVFAFDLLIGRTLRYFYFKGTSGFHVRTTYSMEITEAEILVFGSSEANHHYVPEIFEDSLKASFYNTGRDDSGIFYQTALLKSILKRYVPKVIILNYSGTFDKEELAYDRISPLLPYYRTHREIRSIIELKSPFEKLKLLSEIYPFNSQILSIVVGNLEMNKKRNPDNKGYVALYDEWQAKHDSIQTVTTYEVDSNKTNTLKEFLNISKRAGSKVYVIYSPAFQKFNENQTVEICQNMCNNENVPFWDFSKDTLFINNNRLFQDVEHLNHNGAILFSKLVANKIIHNINE